MTHAPSSFSAKAIGQYRPRDIFTYSSLRLFLQSEFSKSDEFAEIVANNTLRGSKSISYLELNFFKEIDDQGQISHRLMHMPSAVDALGEMYVIANAQHISGGPDKGVCFSYWPEAPASTRGCYLPYMDGIRSRQKAIWSALQDDSSAVVQYLDIKKFYPSIKLSEVKSVWLRHCQENGIPNNICDVGFALIDKYERAGSGELITGPMFSHYLANVMMEKIDAFVKDIECPVFRYVDDFVIVGSPSQIKRASAEIRSRLDEIGLKLHDIDSPKSMTVPAIDWLKSANDFADSSVSQGWMELVSGIKKVCLLNKDYPEALSDSFLADGRRMPVIDYGVAVKERTAFSKVKEMRLWSWLFEKSSKLDPDSLLEMTGSLAMRVEKELTTLLDCVPDSQFERKRLISKIRYRFGRALYLSRDEKLSDLVGGLKEWPELSGMSQVGRAVLTEDCDDVVDFGANIAQSAAQLLRASSRQAKFSRIIDSKQRQIGYLTFAFNGVQTKTQGVIDTPVTRLAMPALAIADYKAGDRYWQELACLNGLGLPRFPELISQAFDADQEITFDAVNLEYGYSI